MTYMGEEVLGDILVGSGAYSQAERAASNRFDQGKLFLVHIAGDASDPFRQERLSIRQSDRFYDLDRRQSVYAGSSDAGKTAEQGNFSVAMVLPEDLDLAQGFTVSYDPENGQQPLTIDVRINGVQRNLALGEPVPSAFAAPLTSDNNWSRLIPLAVLLTLVMVSFWRKSAALRWVALSATLLWLGFIDGGFLSVSHILNGLNQGMSLFTGNTALLLIVGFTLVTTLIWGRVFCSSVCPFGALQDIISYLTPKKWQRTVPAWLHDKAIYLKYLILLLLVGLALFYSQISLFQYFEPFGTLFFYSTSLVLWGILALILLACIPVKRFYCRYVCPLGASLGVLSLISISRIKRVEQCTVCKVCEHSCPTGAIRKEKVDFKECVRCDICESKLIQKAGVCKHSVDSLIDRGVIARGG
jgi:ferredoxin